MLRMWLQTSNRMIDPKCYKCGLLFIVYCGKFDYYLFTIIFSYDR